MASNNEKSEYLRNHLAYEIAMLCFTRSQIAEQPPGPLRNALFESFAVHARICRKLLLNEDGSNNFKANEFVTDFSVDRVGTDDLFNKLNDHVLHLSKSRRAADRRLTLTHLNDMMQWLVNAFAAFGAALKSPYAEIWSAPLAEAKPNPKRVTRKRKLKLPGQAPSATNFISSVTSSPQALIDSVSDQTTVLAYSNHHLVLSPSKTSSANI